jgi:hypothetical protein
MRWKEAIRYSQIQISVTMNEQPLNKTKNPSANFILNLPDGGK